MFVRWQKRIRRTAVWDKGVRYSDVHLAAILVEAKRVNGKPIQRHLAYLGGITKRKVESPTHRIWFWESVEQRLDELKLGRTERGLIEAAIVKVVVRPTSAEQAEVKRRHEEAEIQLRALGVIS